MQRSLREVVEIARQTGKGVAFQVSKVDRRRWNWELSVRYFATDPVTGQCYPAKTVLRAGNNREALETMRSDLERQYGDI